MRKIFNYISLFILALGLIGISGFDVQAQSKGPKAFSSKSVDEKAVFIGGNRILAQMLNDSMVFPPDARMFCTNGTVSVAFVIQPDGTVSDLRVKNKTKVGHGCEEEALRLIEKTSGRWSPAKIKNKPVKQHKRISIRFRQNCSDTINFKGMYFPGNSLHDSIVLTPWARCVKYYWPLTEVKEECLAVKKVSPSEVIYTKSEVDRMPFFKQYYDGEARIGFGSHCWIALRKAYPHNNNTDSTFTFKFSYVVEKDGALSEVKLISPGGGSEHAATFRKIISSTSGHWSPAIKDGQKVRSRRTLTVFFVIPT